MSSLAGENNLSIQQAALAALLGSSSLGQRMPAAGLESSDTTPSDVTSSDVTSSEEEQAELRRLSVLASGGHSPSARALVNASDLLTSLSLATAPVSPSAGLRARLLHSSAASTSVSSSESVVAPLQGPQELLSALHMALPEDLERRRIIDSFGATGGVGQEAVDASIRSLLERLAPFMDFEVVLVSVVYGAVTHHRIHRGFPAAFGNVDVVPREAAYCTHCVSANAPLLVHDGASEAFFRQGVMVQKMGARAYLGYPIRVGSDRTPIGALCCIGRRPRHITPAEVAFVEVFADEVQAIVTQDAARRAEIAVGHEEALPIYREPWLRRVMSAELERWRVAQSDYKSSVSADAVEPGASILVVAHPAEVSAEAWNSFLGDTESAARKNRLVAALDDGRHAVLLAGGPSPGFEHAEDAGSAEALNRIRAAVPGARVARADVTMSSAEAWIVSVS